MPENILRMQLKDDTEKKAIKRRQPENGAERTFLEDVAKRRQQKDWANTR